MLATSATQPKPGNTKTPRSQPLQPLWWENPLARDGSAHLSTSLQISRTDILRMSTALVATIGDRVACGSGHSSHEPQALAHPQPSTADGINHGAPGPAHSKVRDLESQKAGGNDCGHCYETTAGVAHEHRDIDGVDIGRYEETPSARVTSGLLMARGSSQEWGKGSTNGEASTESTRYSESSSSSSSNNNNNKPRPQFHLERLDCITGSHVEGDIFGNYHQERVSEHDADGHANEAAHAAEHPRSDHLMEIKAELQQASGSKPAAASAKHGQDSTQPCFRFAAGSQHSCSTHRQPPSTSVLEAPYLAALGQSSLDERSQGRRVLADVLNSLSQVSATRQDAQGRPTGVQREGKGSLPDTPSVSCLLWLLPPIALHDGFMCTQAIPPLIFCGHASQQQRIGSHYPRHLTSKA